MGQLRLKTDECDYKEKGIRPKVQFINAISDEEMMTEIIRASCNQRN